MSTAAGATYRQLQAGDPLPEGEPKRYGDGRGYIRLRWLVDTNTYVEVYEHRLVAGLPDAEVHHGNDDKADNHPDNLQPLTKIEHALLHGAERIGPNELWAQIAREYMAGMTTTQLAEKYNRTAGNMSRRLRAFGVQMRPSAPPLCGIDEDMAAQMLSQPGARATRVAAHFGVTKIVMRRIQRERGISPAPTGRPPADAPA